jgi:predicted Rossmann-fold nucleotide-binding protein
VRVAVFTGSQTGPPSHREAAATFATELARAGVGIVYGGGRVGLMGTVADAALVAGGEVVGVIPQHLVDDGYLDAARLDALGVVTDAAGLLAFVESYEHPARKWRKDVTP